MRRTYQVPAGPFENTARRTMKTDTRRVVVPQPARPTKDGSVQSEAMSDWVFFRRVLVVVATVAATYLVWKIAALFFLFFATVLIAVLLAGLAGLVATFTSMSRSCALAASSVTVAAVVVAILGLFGTQLAGQISDVFARLPGAIEAGGEQLGIHNAFEQIKQAISAEGGGQLLSRVASLGYTAMGVATDLVLIIVMAVYLAADPRLYRAGMIKLFPPEQHERVGDALDVTASALRLWFLGQLVSMVLVGVLSGFAFWAIGLPSPLGLALVASATNFVPMIGPLIGAMPALLFAVTQDLATAFWTMVAVLAVQQLEGNLITPMVQRRAVDIPPALMLLGIAVFGLLGGIAGIIFAVPLTVAIMVLVQKLWIRETLGEKTTIPGET
ncbi:MAG: AI-2E family transporter [Nitrobacter sp.]|uniref:AI-2E family transporter n=1 Tax=Nitrobacter sp. TaxID=29420 RepID=UPI002635A74C|nr:AI-2E family transporter [Nitrobacter sp.]MCV0387860.1 AI-2E family transporter [Nitrobacter sp.]